MKLRSCCLRITAGYITAALMLGLWFVLLVGAHLHGSTQSTALPTRRLRLPSPPLPSPRSRDIAAPPGIVSSARTPAPSATVTAAARGARGAARDAALAAKAPPNPAQPAVAARDQTGALASLPAASSRVFAFYYAWYKSAAYDGAYSHWNHEYLPHWDATVAKRFKTGRHEPELGDVGASFFPRLGAYSSNDASVVAAHMRGLRAARVGVLALSWYPPGTADQPGANTPDEQVVALLDAAHAAGLAVALHVEPYPKRTAASVGRDIAYAIREYGAHPGLHRDARTGLPVFFV